MKVPNEVKEFDICTDNSEDKVVNTTTHLIKEDSEVYLLSENVKKYIIKNVFHE